MTDEDRSESPTPADETASDVVLPEHASAYFSPRPPPALTQHRTIETEAVQFDPAIDPDLAETRRMQARSSEPPTWPDVERPVANAPTVLVPIVRARRMRRRVVVGLAAALIGGTAGVVFGLLDEPKPEGLASGQPAITPPPVATQAVTAVSAILPTARAPIPVAELPALEPDIPEPKKSASGSATAEPRGPKATPKTSAWIKSEPPRAWIR